MLLLSLSIPTHQIGLGYLGHITVFSMLTQQGICIFYADSTGWPGLRGAIFYANSAGWPGLSGAYYSIFYADSAGWPGAYYSIFYAICLSSQS